MNPKVSHKPSQPHSNDDKLTVPESCLICIGRVEQKVTNGRESRKYRGPKGIGLKVIPRDDWRGGNPWKLTGHLDDLFELELLIFFSRDAHIGSFVDSHVNLEGIRNV